MVNSLAFCVQAVFAEAQIMAGAVRPSARDEAPPFAADELREYLQGNAASVREAGYEETAAARGLAVDGIVLSDREAFYRRLRSGQTT